MRLRKQHDTRERLAAYPGYATYAKKDVPLAIHEWFAKDQPFYAEFGMGKGQFIVEMAKKNPQINFIGFELRDQVLLKAVKKAASEGLENIHFVVGNLQHLTTFLGENALDRIFLNFSDPWPKTRHYKRRLTYRAFLDQYKQVLKDQGEVVFKTDNKGLFQFTLNELADTNRKMRKISLDVHEDQRFEDNIMTEYEEKFSSKGYPIYSVTFKP